MVIARAVVVGARRWLLFVPAAVVVGACRGRTIVALVAAAVVVGAGGGSTIVALVAAAVVVVARSRRREITGRSGTVSVGSLG
jgi:hypothetical protein